jgi:hypothetical protein
MRTPVNRRTRLLLAAAVLAVIAGCGYVSVGMNMAVPAPWGSVSVGTSVPIGGPPGHW